MPLSMIAVVPGINPAVPPCPIKWVGKRGMMSVIAITYCGNEAGVAAGVSQVPAHARFCPKCEAAINAQFPLPTAG